MGKRVFEVAKELGIDHRELLLRCDQFRIDVKNYMSFLSSDDEGKLRAALEAERQPKTVDERLQAPGVVRRRRRTSDDKAAKPPLLKPAKPGVSARTVGRSVRTPETPVSRNRGPLVRTPQGGAKPVANEAQPATPRGDEASSLVAKRPTAPPEVKRAAKPAGPAAKTASVESEPLSPTVTKAVDTPVSSESTRAEAEPATARRLVSEADRAAPDGAETKAMTPETVPPSAHAPSTKVQSDAGPTSGKSGKSGKSSIASAADTPKAAEPGPATVAKPVPLEASEPESKGRSTVAPARPEPVAKVRPESAAPVAKGPSEKAPSDPKPASEAPATPVVRAGGVRPGKELPNAAQPERPDSRVSADRSPDAAATPRREGGERPVVRSERRESDPRKGRSPAAAPRPHRPGAEAPVRRGPAEKGKPPEVVRPAAPRVAKPAPGAAKILGTIPLDQLRSRTARPAPRRSAGGDRRVPTGDRRVSRRPVGGNAQGPQVDVNAAVPLPVDRGGDRRRKPGGAECEADRSRQGRTAGKKRQVYNREDLYSSSVRGARGRRRKVASRKGAKTQLTTPAAHKRIVRIDGTVSAGELAKALGVKANEILGKLVQSGMMVTINQQVDLETAAVIAADYDFEVQNIGFDEDAVLSLREEVAETEGEFRAPVVTIMGHVDHGKTTLLDHIRNTSVAKHEAGGITQHIGAYKVPVADSHVVFLDTPGHAAFTAMRARGAKLTDLVVLVVAADDGVMPQTVEAINHARAAEVPLVVAINKIDKPGADLERLKQEMTKYELVPEEWGGETMFIPISALKGTGIQDLLEALALQSEILELRASADKTAYGRVIEARLDKSRGPVSTVLVQDGTLKLGDFIVSGQNYGRVRAMTDELGRKIEDAGPSTPVEILGLGGVAAAGDPFQVAATEKEAKRVVSSRLDKAREVKESDGTAARDLVAMMGQPEKEELNVLIKSDVQGSLEAVRPALEQLSTDEVGVKTIHGGVGGITESDINLAQASSALIIGFNVSPDAKAKRLADQAGVNIETHSVIYELIDAVRDRMSGLLAPEIIESDLGRAEVRALFHVPRVGTVAGCMVQEGKVVRNSRGRVRRNGDLVAEGKLVSLKRFKEDVREVAQGFECGLAIEHFNDVQVGDVIEVFEVKEVRRQLK